MFKTPFGSSELRSSALSSLRIHKVNVNRTAYIHLRFATMNELSVGFVSLTLFEACGLPLMCHLSM